MNFFACIFFQIVWLDLKILSHQMAETIICLRMERHHGKAYEHAHWFDLNTGAKSDIQRKCMEGRHFVDSTLFGQKIKAIFERLRSKLSVDHN